MADGGIGADAIRDARAALARPIGEAEGLPGRFYGEDFYRLEQRTLFPKSWCAVAVGASLPEPGDMLPVDLAGWPILLIRGTDGEIRAFHNICRHRAMRLVAEPCKAARVRCPWHSWTYDLTGKLLAMPEIGGARINAAPGFDKSALGLVPIPVGRWLDYVFVNIDGAAPPFADHIAPAKALLADLDLGDVRHGGGMKEVYHGNWKLFTEGFIEDYHLTSGHPQMQAHEFRNTAPCTVPGVYAGGWMSFGEPEDGASDFEPEADPTALPPLLMKDGHPLSSMLVLNLFPTGMILLGPNELMVGILAPDGDTRTRVELNCYFRGDAATSAELQSARQGNFDMWKEIIAQDFPFVIGTQASAAVRDDVGVRTRFSPYWEKPVLEFQSMVLDSLDA